MQNQSPIMQLLSIFIPAMKVLTALSWSHPLSLCLLPSQSPHSRWRFSHCLSVNQSEDRMHDNWPMREQVSSCPLIPCVLTPGSWPGSASSPSPPHTLHLSPFQQHILSRPLLISSQDMYSVNYFYFYYKQDKVFLCYNSLMEICAIRDLKERHERPLNT